MRSVSNPRFPRWSAAIGILCFASLFPALGQVESDAKGLVISKPHSDSPDDLAATREFSVIERFGRVTNVTPVGGGTKLRLNNDQVTEVVEYFDQHSATIQTDAQIAEFRTRAPALGALAKKYRSAYNLLVAEGLRLQGVIKQLDEGKLLVRGEWKSKGEMEESAADKGESLTITIAGEGERTFTGVKVTGQEPDALQIMHSGGAMSIPYDQLAEADQKKFGFDPVKAEEFRKQKAMAATPTSELVKNLLTGVWIETQPSVLEIGAITTTLQDKIELANDGTARCYSRSDSSTKDGNLGEWSLSYESTWRVIESQFSDTGKPFRGFEIAGKYKDKSFIQRLRVYILGTDGNVFRTINSEEVNESLLRDEGSMADFTYGDAAKSIRESYLEDSIEFGKEGGIDQTSLSNLPSQNSLPQTGNGSGSEGNPAPSPDVGQFLAAIGPGLSIHANGGVIDKQFREVLNAMDSFHTAALYEKGKAYAIHSLAGQSFEIQQRTGGALLINDINGKPCAILTCAPADLLEGKRLQKGQRAWAIGMYDGDQELDMTLGGARTFPLFRVGLLCWNTSEGVALLNFAVE